MTAAGQIEALWRKGGCVRDQLNKADILGARYPRSSTAGRWRATTRLSAASYPAHWVDPKNVTAATRAHNDKWHGGNFQNETHGQPLKPDHKDEF